MTDLYPVTAAVTGVLGLAAGALVPRLIAPCPEPEPERARAGRAATGRATDEPRAGGAQGAYADIAALPGLAWKAALAAGGRAAGCSGWCWAGSWSLLVRAAAGPGLVALAVVDWRTRLLPTRLVAPTYAVTVVDGPGRLAGRTAGTSATWCGPRLGWLVYGGMFFVLWFVYPRGLGYGDVRLSGVLGLALG